jgi:hypothetical protein
MLTVDWLTSSRRAASMNDRVSLIATNVSKPWRFMARQASPGSTSKSRA